MKTTSGKISKQLAEIGFKAKTNFLWRPFINTKGLIEYNLEYVDQDYIEPPINKTIRAYDLETILEALPNFTIFSFVSQIFYNNNGKPIIIIKKPDDSWADCAAELLIKLVEDKIIIPKQL